MLQLKGTTRGWAGQPGHSSHVAGWQQLPSSAHCNLACASSAATPEPKLQATMLSREAYAAREPGQRNRCGDKGEGFLVGGERNMKGLGGRERPAAS